MIRAVIFDFNGVLVDDEHVHFELFREVLAQEGVELTAEQIPRAVPRPRRPRLLRGRPERRRAGGRPGSGRRPDRAEGRALRRGRPRPGLRYLPRRGRVRWPRWPARWPLAICSGALRPEIEFALDRLGRRDRVAAIVSAEDTTRCKPDPQGYLLALDAPPARRTRPRPTCGADECLVIEDSLAGVASAKGAGMWAVGIAQTYEPAELRGAGADAVLAGLDRARPRSGSSGHSSPPCGAWRDGMATAMNPWPRPEAKRRPACS